MRAILLTILTTKFNDSAILLQLSLQSHLSPLTLIFANLVITFSNLQAPSFDSGQIYLFQNEKFMVENTTYRIMYVAAYKLDSNFFVL